MYLCRIDGDEEEFLGGWGGGEEKGEGEREKMVGLGWVYLLFCEYIKMKDVKGKNPNLFFSRILRTFP